MTIPVAGPSGMTIPALDPWAFSDPELEWSALSTDAKRERILRAAGKVFTAEGLSAPMPAVAAAAGAGVATVYRQFPSKRDLLAALVTRRLEQIADAATAAANSDADHWTALTEMLWMIVERQSGDDFLGEAWLQVSDHQDVAHASTLTTAALGRLLAAARAEKRLRQDATTLDLRLLFAATRAAKQVEPEAWQRMLTLLIDGLDTSRHS